MNEWARGETTLEVALAVIVLLLASSCHSSSDERTAPSSPPPVRCEPVVERMVQSNVRLRGTVAAPPNEDAIVSSAVPGRIVSLHVVEGDTVAKGELLAVVENPSLESDLAKAAASVASAQASLENAKRALDRKRKLFDQGIAARREVDDAEARAASAAAELTAARAQQRLAQRESARARVGAPIAGTVVKVTRKAGELVDGTPATPIVEVANTSVLELSCDVASTDLVRIEEGAGVEVRLDALPDQTIDAKVERIAPTVDSTTSLGRVRIELSPPKALVGRLRIGMSGEASLTTDRRRALVVTPTALRRSQDGHEQVVVCAVHEGGMVAAVKNVTVGARDDSWVEISGGASAGTLVVVDRSLGLQDGTPITRRKPDKPTESSR